LKAADLLKDRWAFGPWCYTVAELFTLSAPLAISRGMLGFWPLETAVAATLHTLTGRAVNLGMTLQQPYASAIAYGPKRIENRPQRRSLPPEGLWVALHAGGTLYCPEQRLKSATDAGDSQRSARYLYVHDLLDEWRHGFTADGAKCVPMWEDAPDSVAGLPLSCILGVMRLEGPNRYPDKPEPSKAQGNMFAHRSISEHDHDLTEAERGDG
jgi:hypothetical protein